jgi:hypothetical protein
VNFYAVVATTTPEGWMAPDIPADVSWVGQYDPAAATYLIATPADLSGVQGATAVTEADLPTVCAARGLQVADVLRWSC